MPQSPVIVLAEDDSAVRILVKKILERHNYIVYCAEHGAEALQIVEALKGQVDLLVADLVMPKMGGRALRAKLQEFCVPIPVIYLTGWDSDPDEDSTGKACQILLKPFTPQKLLSLVESALLTQSRAT